MLPPTHWIESYVSWATKRSPLTPAHFHEAIAYTLAACAIAGRICVRTPQGRIYPNLYTLLLGKTSVYAKTVAMDLGQELAALSMIDDRVINSVFTPESIIGELAGEKPTNLTKLSEWQQQHWKDSSRWGACRMFRLDEAGVFFNALRRDYNAGLQDLWMKFYDCPPVVERTTFSHGLHVIEQPVLSCLFATTPASIAPMIRDQALWLQGFWPRWNFCVGAGFTDFVHSIQEEPTEALYKGLLNLGNNRFGRWTADKPLIVPVDDQVMLDYGTVLEGNRKRTFEGADGYMEAALSRLHTKRMKLALILAAFDDEPKVTMEQWAATAKPVKQIELDMVEALVQCRKTEKAQQEDAVLRFIRARGGKATLRDIQRHMHQAQIELKPLFDGLIGSGSCEIQKDGRVSWLCLVGDGSGSTLSL